MYRTKKISAALLCGMLLVGSAQADNAWFSLNLQFNDPADFGSGGTWTVVGKADERGFQAIILQFVASSLNFDAATGFLTPAGFEVEESGTFGLQLEMVQGDDPASPTLDVGVIGGTYPSSYVDDARLVTLGANPDLGSFTGGVELVTGTFDPGDIPTWVTSGSDQTTAALHSGFPPPNHFIEATEFITVRYVAVPEPASLLLLGGGMIALAAIRRR